jgi:hypothetical protein
LRHAPWPLGRGTLGCGLLLLAMLGVQIGLFAGAEVDDSYISYRYAQNLVHGHGLVYNAAEPPVEGYSNFLWTLLHLPAVDGSADPMRFSKVLGLVLLGANLALTAALIRQVAPGAAALPWLGLLLLASSPAFVYWHLVGMEPPLVCFWLLLALLLSAREQSSGRLGGSWLAWLGLALTRIDAVLLVAAAAVVQAIHTATSSDAARWRRFGLRWGLFAAAYAAYTACRSAYYGDLMPNVYYAKLQETSARLGPGLQYLASILRAYPLLALVPLAAALVWRGEPRPRPVVAPAAVLLAVQIAYIVWVGGDWMPLGRFFAPLAPLVAVFLIAAPSAVRATTPPRWAVAIAAAAPVLGVLAYLLGPEPFQVQLHTQNTRTGKLLGRSLARVGPNLVTANAAAGAAPYFSGCTNIDTNGITDRHIARVRVPRGPRLLAVGHDKGDGDYVLGRGPDVLVFVLGRSGTPGLYPSDAAMAFDPRLYADYEPFTNAEPRRVQRQWFLRLSQRQVDQLTFLADLRRAPSRFGVVLESTPALQFTILRRTPPGPASPPSRAAFLAIAGAVSSRNWLRADSLLEANSAVIAADGLGDVIEPMRMRFALARGDGATARTCLARARNIQGRYARLLQLWLHTDPALQAVLRRDSPDSPS